MLCINKSLNIFSNRFLLLPTRQVFSNSEICKIFMSSSFNYEVIKPWKVTKMQAIPDHILKPPYHETGIPEGVSEDVEIKNAHQIEHMKKSGKLAGDILKSVEPLIKAGVTTDFIDEQIHKLIIRSGAYPSPLNYHGFPKSICTSVNNVACHGIPDDRPLRSGDTLNVDITVFFNGYHGDCSRMFTVDEVDCDAKKLINATENCLNAAIKICKPNENFNSIGSVIEEVACQYGYSVVPSIAGHGIGSYFHGQPDILHFANLYPGKMKPGMTFTIEPSLSEGDTELMILDDHWTAITTDDARTAQMEHTILITEHGCEVLTV